MIETQPDRDERQIEALGALMGINPDADRPDAVEPPKDPVHQCFLDEAVLGPDTPVIRVAMADDPDRTVYFHTAEEETATVYGEVVDSGLLIECEDRIEPNLEP